MPVAVQKQARQHRAVGHHGRPVTRKPAREHICADRAAAKECDTGRYHTEHGRQAGYVTVRSPRNVAVVRKIDCRAGFELRSQSDRGGRRITYRSLRFQVPRDVPKDREPKRDTTGSGRTVPSCGKIIRRIHVRNPDFTFRVALLSRLRLCSRSHARHRRHLSIRVKARQYQDRR